MLWLEILLLYLGMVLGGRKKENIGGKHGLIKLFLIFDTYFFKSVFRVRLLEILEGYFWRCVRLFPGVFGRFLEEK